MKRPFFTIACIFLSGILYALEYRPAALLVCTACLAVAVRRPFKDHDYPRLFFRIALAASFFLAGALLTGQEKAFRLEYQQKLTDEETVSLCAVVSRKEYKNEKYRYYTKDTVLCMKGEEIPCNSVLIYFDTDDYQIGDTLLIEGQVHLFETAVNEGMFDLRSFYAARKIDFSLYPQKTSLVQRQEFPLGEYLYRLRCRLRDAAEEAENIWISWTGIDSGEGVISSMLLGDKSLLDADIQSLYRSSGISHILAISGLHVSLIGMGLYRLLRKGGRSFLASAVCAGIFLVLYCRMTGNGISSVRAVIMLLFSLAAQVCGRRSDMLNSFGLAGLFMLWENPFLVSDAGFQISAAAMIGIAVVGDAFAAEEKARTIPQKIEGQLFSGLAVTLSTLPLIAYDYYEIPLYAVFLNMLVLPLLTLLFISGAAGTLAALFSPGMGAFLLAPAQIILCFYQKLCLLVQRIPGSLVITGKPGPFLMILYYLLLAAGCGLIFYRKARLEEDSSAEEDTKKEDRNAKADISSADKKERLQKNKGMGRKDGRKDACRRMNMEKILLSAMLFALILFPKIQQEELDFLDVGQGDGIFLELGGKTSVFIDGGSVTEDQAGTYRILPFLKSKGIRRIDYWFISHADQDHISGMEEVLASGYPVRYLVLSAYMPMDDAKEEILSAAEAAGTEVIYMKPQDTLSSGGSELTCLYPDQSAAETYDDRNDLSLALLYENSSFSAIMAGDLSSEAEESLLETAEISEVDILKVCHHGSRYSSSENFLERLNPVWAVISCGEGNTYGHPAPEAVERLNAAGCRICYTMYSGEISFRADRKGKNDKKETEAVLYKEK